MDNDDDRPKTSENRMAIGVALGVPVGVALSLVLDNWAMIGVGIALGAAFGAIPTGRTTPPGNDDAKE